MLNVQSVYSDRAYDFIRKKILAGEYPPGAALMTEQLSVEIGVSRTPVRDALRQLESDGLVSIRPRQGASVKQVDLGELREMCELRLALEGHAAHLAALNRTPAELAEIKIALDAMSRLVGAIAAADTEEGLHSELMNEDVRFHVAIMTAAKNNLMKNEILRLHLINRVLAGTKEANRTQKTRPDKREADERRKQVYIAHRDICDAIARRDGPTAKAAMERHIQELIEHTLREFAQLVASRGIRPLGADELLYQV